MNQILYGKKQPKKVTIVFVGILIVLFLLLAVGIGFTFGNMNSKQILANVKINGIEVGGLTKEAAIEKIEKEIASTQDKTITFSYEDYLETISVKELALTANVEEAVNKAYNYGRDSHVLANNLTVIKSKFQTQNIDMEINLEKAAYEEVIKNISESVGKTVKDDAYEVTDKELIFTVGNDGIKIKEEELREKILEEILLAQTEPIEIPVEVAKANKLNMDQVYQEVYKEPKDASYTTTNGKFEVHNQVIGVNFNKEEAKQKYDNAKEGETIKIALEITNPKVFVENLTDVLFQDLLASFKTNYNAGNKARSENLRLSAEKINGKVIYPGEIFSYNEVVGKRTVEAGYQLAHVYVGGKVVDGLGGGICQVSSTLYNAMLVIDKIETIERKNHAMYPEYVKPGRDATIVYGSIDYKFKNNQELPIKIVCSVKNGVCSFEVYGTKQDDDMTIELETKILKTMPYTTTYVDDPNMEEGKTQVTQAGVNGYVSETYKILKNSAGEQVSRTLVSKDTYKITEKIVKRGTKVVAPPVVDPEPEVPVDEPENPTEVTKPNETLPPGWDNPENPWIQ